MTQDLNVHAKGWKSKQHSCPQDCEQWVITQQPARLLPGSENGTLNLGCPYCDESVIKIILQKTDKVATGHCNEIIDWKKNDEFFVNDAPLEGLRMDRCMSSRISNLNPRLLLTMAVEGGSCSWAHCMFQDPIGMCKTICPLHPILSHCLCKDLQAI